TQHGMELPLTLERVDEIPKPARPQHPEPPFPYPTEDATFPGGADSVTLAGTLCLPDDSGGPSPAVVLVSGSGPQDRDESLLGPKPFLVIADHFARRGVAVRRYGDRGFGESTGDFASATTVDFKDDALAALAWLRERPEI